MSKWTPDMEAALRAAAPVSFESAEELAGTLSVSKRSVIAKVKQMGLDYIPKAKAVSTRDTGPTKAEVIASIRARIGVDASREGDLAKAELVTILSALAE